MASIEQKSVEAPIFDDPDYELLSEIRTSDGYDDPSALLEKINMPQGEGLPYTTRPTGLEENTRSFRNEDIDEALSGGVGTLVVPCSSLSTSSETNSSEQAHHEASLIQEETDSDSSEEIPITERPTLIRQSWTGRQQEMEKDEKLYVLGTLVENRAPLSFKSRVARLNSAGSIEDQGIYQGLVMTDSERQRLGIMPESIYMTAALEQWADELEHMTLELHTAGVPEPPRQRSSAFSTPTGSLEPSKQAITPKYRDSILRPPPLPPLPAGVTIAQKKAYAVVENLLKSEAAFLTSLNIAINSYMRPLTELSLGPSPILDKEQVEGLFGPITRVISHHELFYTALTSRTMHWTPIQRIGDIFMSSFARKEVVKYYSEYVNNFTLAMSILEMAIKKKPKFVTFLKFKYTQSKTSLSLQGLLLKPIQRFPQYILFVQDLLKYTSTTHPDRLHLQMSLARFEGIAEYLNETKRRKEQHSIVQYLNSRVYGLPFKLMDSKRWLHRQDVVTRLMYSKGNTVLQRQRCLLLFNNMVLCAAMKRRPKKGDLESSTGSKDFKGNEGATYTCKWHNHIDDIQVMEPDYNNDIWDLVMEGDDSENAEVYHRLKSEYKRLEHDFLTMSKIAGLVSVLNEEFQGLTVQNIQHYTRVLQRKLAKHKELIQLCQVGRIDILIPSRDGSKQVHHTYIFESEREKQNWLNTLRFAKLKQDRANSNAWVFAEDPDDEDDLDTVHKLPLFLDTFKLMVDESLSVECAVKVSSKEAWFASGNSTDALVTVVNCVPPSPIILECFEVDSSRIMTLISVPPATTPVSRQGTLSLPLLSHIVTVWMGSQNGKLLIYNASSEASKRCISSVQFPDSITCLHYYCDQVFLATAEGNLILFKRASGGYWDLNEYKTFPVHQGAIRCLCAVGKRFWIGAGNMSYIFNMDTHKIESTVELGTDPVSKMVCEGAGIWASFSRSATLTLYHTVTQLPLQEIDIKAALNRIISKHKLDKLSNLERLHVTALLASNSYLWIGTSVGAILVYRIPHLGGVPLVSGKPCLAMDSMKAAVRVLLEVKSLATVSSSRVSQFISDEEARNIQQNGGEAVGEIFNSMEETLPRMLLAAGQQCLDNRQRHSSGFSVPESDVIYPRSPSPLPVPCFEDSVRPGEESNIASVVEGEVWQLDQTPTGTPEEEASKQIIGEEERQEEGEAISEKLLADETSASDNLVDTVEKEKIALEDPYEVVEVEVSGERVDLIELKMSESLVNDTNVVTVPQLQDNLPEPESGGTFNRIPSPDIHLYDDVEGIEGTDVGAQSYEIPPTLDQRANSISTPELFSPLASITPTIPGRPVRSPEGAIFVLAAGRGIVNLRPVKRTTVLFPSARSNSVVSSAGDEGCMIAYEIEH